MDNDKNLKTSASDEIDLLELFSKMWRGIKNGISWCANLVKYLFLLLVRKSLWIIGFGIVGFIIGIVFFFTSPRYYSSEMTAISNALNNNYIISSINLLNDLFKDKNYEVASNYLGMSIQDAGKIRSIAAYYGIDVNKDGIVDYVDYDGTYKPKDTSVNRSSSFFFIKLEVYSENIFGAARDGLKKYIYKNNYILENNRIRIAQGENMISSITQEIQKLDSLQKIEYFEVPRTQKASTSQMVILNEKEIKLYHEQILGLEREKLKI
ncbi:MAG: hypothetical protein AB7S54_12165, partial [Bacteroidales bacterium]